MRSVSRWPTRPTPRRRTFATGTISFARPRRKRRNGGAGSMTKRVAILGGGMFGVCAALELAHRGQRVVLVEGALDLLEGAGRWNEGKIHLGFLYAGDPSLSTATRLI